MAEIGAGRRGREVWLTFRRIAGVNLVVHLLGTVLTFCYFRFIDLTKEVGTDILVSATTRRLFGDAHELVALPAVRVKGKSAEVEVYRVG